nr:MAG TPA: hypothetical protein [Caudoviricetes sp.]
MKITIECDNFNEIVKNFNYSCSTQPKPIFTNCYVKINKNYLMSIGLYNNKSDKLFDLYINGFIYERGLYTPQLINTILQKAHNKDGIVLRSYNDYGDVYLYLIE